jgi:hypothetical protein
MYVYFCCNVNGCANIITETELFLSAVHVGWKNLFFTPFVSQLLRWRMQWKVSTVCAHDIADVTCSCSQHSRWWWSGHRLYRHCLKCVSKQQPVHHNVWGEEGKGKAVKLAVIFHNEPQVNFILLHSMHKLYCIPSYNFKFWWCCVGSHRYFSDAVWAHTGMYSP